MSVALLSWLRPRLKHRTRPFILGISGAQGSGKSTLCAEICRVLTGEGLSVLVLSLDDLYLSRAERLQLGARIHPLCALRGLPGTHDIGLAHRLFDQLLDARAHTKTAIPRFDKSTDDRRPKGDMFVGRPDLILFEGWCVGAVAGPVWTGPLNDREARDDPDGVFMRWSEAALCKDYLDLWARLDGLWMLQVRSFEYVVAGRLRQERALRERQPDGAGVMTDAGVTAYVALFERKTRQMLADLPGRADGVLPAYTPLRSSLNARG